MPPKDSPTALLYHPGAAGRVLFGRKYVSAIQRECRKSWWGELELGLSEQLGYVLAKQTHIQRELLCLKR